MPPAPAQRGRVRQAVRRLAWPAAVLLAPPALGAQALAVSIPPNLILPNYGRVAIGQRGALEAGAFTARTDDVAAGWYNPAGLVRSVGTAINASATTYDWTRVWLDGLGTTVGASRVSSIGTLFAAVLGEPVLHGDRLRVGFSVARPIAWRPSGLDARSTRVRGDTTQQVDYEADVELSSYFGSLTVGWAPGGARRGTLRLGAGFGLWWTDLSHSQAVTARALTPAALQLVSRSYSAAGTTISAVLVGGAQWDARPNLVLGLRALSPGLRIVGSTGLRYESLVTAADSRTELSFRDPDARFRYDLPLELDGGAALRLGRGELEVDLHYHSAVGAYTLYASDSTGTLIRAPAGGAPTLAPVPFAPPRNGARTVVGVAAGGSYLVTRGVRLHAGFTSDPSPVPDDSASIFRKVDVTVATTGVSLTGQRLSGSLGVAYSTGRGARAIPDPAGSDASLHTHLRVQSLNLLYALTYSF